MKRKNETVIKSYYITHVCEIPANKNSPKCNRKVGEKIYFCGDGCKVEFEDSAGKFMTKAM
jgi:YHS domain-containing protein